MSWLGLRYKGIEPLYPSEWNAVVDGLDILYAYVADLNRRLDCLEPLVQQIYLQTKPPEKLETLTKTVDVTPVPLSDVDMEVKRIHVKVPSWALYLVYVGDASRQDFVLEPGDDIELEIKNPKNIYVRSLGNVTIFVAFEV